LLDDYYVHYQSVHRISYDRFGMMSIDPYSYNGIVLLDWFCIHMSLKINICLEVLAKFINQHILDLFDIISCSLFLFFNKDRWSMRSLDANSKWVKVLWTHRKRDTQ
jgi:hypothetical protein